MIKIALLAPIRPHPVRETREGESEIHDLRSYSADTPYLLCTLYLTGNVLNEWENHVGRVFGGELQVDSRESTN